jgi:hypothetical protein
MDDKRDECGCHRECTVLPHSCAVPCAWPDCLTEAERSQLCAEIKQGFGAQTGEQAGAPQ